MTRAQDVEAEWVASRRAARMGWAAIARMAGCSELDLRRHHDPLAPKADVAVRAESPRDRVCRALRRAGMRADEALIIARLWQANGARLKSHELARGVAGGGAAVSICREAKLAAMRLGVGFVNGASGFQLSGEGVGRVSELAGLRGRP